MRRRRHRCHPLEPDGAWTSPLPALVYRGDRYVYKPPGVPGGKRVDPSNDPASGWSFIACNGSAASKMHLFRHTWAGGVRDVSLRTTLLKAITADYCGDGLGTYTRPGNPLAFAINGGGTSFPDPYGSGMTVEAILTEYPAVTRLCPGGSRLRCGAGTGGTAATAAYPVRFKLDENLPVSAAEPWICLRHEALMGFE